MARHAAGRIALLVAFLATAAASQAGPAAVELDAASSAWAVLSLSGKQTLTCKSRWHDVKLDASISGVLPVTVGGLVGPPEGCSAVGDAWDVPEEQVGNLGRTLLRALRLEHRDPEAYERWRGEEPEDLEVIAGGQLRARLAAVTPGEAALVARIELDGRLQADESGAVERRYGPRRWRATWALPVHGTVEVDLAQREVRSVNLTSEGRVTGGYGPHDGEPTEPYEIAVSLRLELGPLPEDLAKQLDRLVGELGHDAYARREAATREAEKLPPHPLNLLLARLERSDDPELRYRAQLLKKGILAATEEPEEPEGAPWAPPVLRMWDITELLEEGAEDVEDEADNVF
jgi:hypothetical protein